MNIKEMTAPWTALGFMITYADGDISFGISADGGFFMLMQMVPHYDECHMVTLVNYDGEENEMTAKVKDCNLTRMSAKLAQVFSDDYGPRTITGAECMEEVFQENNEAQ